MQIYLEWLEIPCIGIFWWTLWDNLVLRIWMHEQHSRSVQVKASNRLGSDNQESDNGHNHACDKIKLTEA
jgi:hypothetical protein